MQRGLQGRWLERTDLDRYRAFSPNALPPQPALAFDELAAEYERATLALGRLDGVSLMLPADLFLYFYVRKEAVLSSQIEGTQSSLSDLLLFESRATPGVPREDVEEVSQYVKATKQATKRLEHMPLSSRLLKETHDVLLSSGRGSTKNPGAFRRSAVWLGGARPRDAEFVPPPHEQLDDHMAALERFLHQPDVPVLIKAALAHAQFETIHPFHDGNGRLGRLLIPLILVSERALSKPLLYLSLFFKQHRARYYALLQGTRLTGDWEAWVRFFLEGVEQTASHAHRVARRALELFERDEMRLKVASRGAASTVALFHELERRPVANAKQLAQLSGLSLPTVMKGLRLMRRLDIVREVTGRQRDQVFRYEPLVELLQQDHIDE